MPSHETVMVVSTFEPVEVGQAFQTLPDHLTHVSWFNLPDANREDFAFVLERVTEENRPPVLLGGSAETFGDQKLGFEEVRRFDRAHEGFNIIQDFYTQAALFAFAKMVDPQFNGRYFGEAWNAHTKAHVAEGEKVPLDNIVAFKKDEQRHQKVVRDVYSWVRR